MEGCEIRCLARILPETDDSEEGPCWNWSREKIGAYGITAHRRAISFPVKENLIL